MMRMIRQMAALLLTVLLLGTTALAEMPFLRYAEGWSLAETPLYAL